MKNKKEKYLIVFVLLLLLGIGYAALSSTLNIIGITNIAKSNWDVHFANITLKDDSVEIDTSVYPDAQAATIDVLDPTKLSYNVLLSEPGDFYEFTVDVVNDGSIDAMISSIESKIRIGNGEETLLTNETLPEYMLYSVTYSNGTEIDLPHELKSKEKDTLLVRVEFKKDITNAQFEEAVGKLLNFKLNIDYVQSTIGEIANNQNTFVDSNPCTYEGDLDPGDTYMGTQYKYIYDKTDNGDGLYRDGWLMRLIDPNSTDQITETMCSTINGKPIVDMVGLFSYSQAESIDLSSFNTYNVTDMSDMFYESKAKNLDLRSFNTSSVTNMSGMFSGCEAETIDVSSFDISNVTDMSSMFSRMNLDELDLSSFNFDTDQNMDLNFLFDSSNIGTVKFKNQQSRNIVSYSQYTNIPSSVTFAESTVYPSTAYVVATQLTGVGQVPSYAVIRNDYQAALNDWQILGGGSGNNFFLKYNMNTTNGTIANQYIGFIVTEDSHLVSPNAVVGMHYLDGDESYETNKNIIQNILDPGNQSSKCSENDDEFSCDVTELYITLNKSGNVMVSNSYTGDTACVINESGKSFCRTHH